MHLLIRLFDIFVVLLMFCTCFEYFYVNFFVLFTRSKVGNTVSKISCLTNDSRWRPMTARAPHSTAQHLLWYREQELFCFSCGVEFVPSTPAVGYPTRLVELSTPRRLPSVQINPAIVYDWAFVVSTPFHRPVNGRNPAAAHLHHLQLQVSAFFRYSMRNTAYVAAVTRSPVKRWWMSFPSTKLFIICRILFDFALFPRISYTSIAYRYNSIDICIGFEIHWKLIELFVRQVIYRHLLLSSWFRSRKHFFQLPNNVILGWRKTQWFYVVTFLCFKLSKVDIIQWHNLSLSI